MADRMMAQPYEIDVKCKACGKIYHQRIEDQVPGFRLMDEDICPYCKNVNGKSMSVEYENSKLE
jgi:hypothetical protein